MELFSAVANPPPLMKSRRDWDQVPSRESQNEEVYSSSSEAKEAQPNEKVGFSSVLKEKANDAASRDKDDPKEPTTDSEVKRFQNGARTEKGKTERQKAIQKFMASFESEFGIPPQEMVAAMAKLSNPQLTQAPEETAEMVIDKLDLDPDQKEKAEQAYVGFLADLKNLEPTKFMGTQSPIHYVRPQILAREGSPRELLLKQKIAGENFAKNWSPERVPTDSGREGGILPSETPFLDEGRFRLEDLVNRDPQLKADLGSDLGEEVASKTLESGDPRGFSEANVLERISASVDRRLSRNEAIESLTNKFWMTKEKLDQQNLVNHGPNENLGAEIPAALMGLRQSGADQGSLTGRNDSQGGFQEGEQFVPSPAEMGTLASIPLSEESPEARQGFQNSEGFSEGESGQERSAQLKSFPVQSKKVNVEEMNFRQMAEQLGQSNQPPEALNSDLKGLNNHVGLVGGAATGLTHETDQNIRQIMTQAQFLIKNGGGEMKVQMSPEGLGNMQLKVSVSEGKVNVQMFTESKEAKNVIENSLADLKSSLSSQKLSVEHIKIDVVNNINTENKADQHSNSSQGSNLNDQRDSTRQFWNQFQEGFGNRSQRNGFFEMAGRGYNARKSRDPLEPVLAPAKARKTEGKGSGLNLVA